jgi:hypothetical protein
MSEHGFNFRQGWTCRDGALQTNAVRHGCNAGIFVFTNIRFNASTLFSWNMSKEDVLKEINRITFEISFFLNILR